MRLASAVLDTYLIIHSWLWKSRTNKLIVKQPKCIESRPWICVCKNFQTKSQIILNNFLRLAFNINWMTVCKERKFSTKLLNCHSLLKTN